MLPAKPQKYPGLPGGKSFNWDSIPVASDGPDPTGGIKAVDKIIPVGTVHYLATPDAPRRWQDRIPPDEFALIVAGYNAKFGTQLSVDPMAAEWKKTSAWWNTREAISRTATGRWNSYLCKQGKGHCPHPGVFSAIGHWVSKAVSSAVHVLGKVSAIAKLIPGIGTAVGGIEMGVDAVNGLKTLASAGSQVVSRNKVLSAGKALVPVTDHAGFDIGAAMMHDPKLTKAKLLAIRNHLAASAKRGFDTAVSIQTGMALADAKHTHSKVAVRVATDKHAMKTGKKPSSPIKGTKLTVPPVLSDTAKAAFYAGVGMQGATPSMQDGMLTNIADHPEAKIGIVLAATEIKDKTLWQKVKEYFGLYDHQPITAAAPKNDNPKAA